MFKELFNALFSPIGFYVFTRENFQSTPKHPERQIPLDPFLKGLSNREFLINPFEGPNKPARKKFL